ncbi:VENN motif pre-toxin domain-containing protein, partial [Photorhabdus luminescens]
TTDPKTHQVDVVSNTLAHAILGAVAAEVSGNNALAGAAGAAGGELAARELMKHIHGENVKVSDLSEEEKQTISTLSTLAAGLAGGIAGDSTGSAVTGAQAGKNAVENNFLGDISRGELEKNREALREGKYTEKQVRELLALEARDQINDDLLNQYRKDPSSLTQEQQHLFQQELQQYAYENTQLYGAETAKQLVTQLLKEGDSPLIPGKGFPYAGSTEEKNAWADRERQKAYEKNGVIGALNWTRTPTGEEKLFKKADGLANTYGYHKDNASIGDSAIQVLPGGVGNAIRTSTGMAGAYDIGKGVRQVEDGNGWEGAGNIVQGALMATGSTWVSKNVKPRLVNASGEVNGPLLQQEIASGKFSPKGLVEAIDPTDEAIKAKAGQALLDVIKGYKSSTQAGKHATMVAAYDPVTGKVAIGGSSGKVTAEMLDPKTVEFVEKRLGVKIGESTTFCNNLAGSCAEIFSADQLIRQGVEPSAIKFTDALRPREVWKRKGLVNDKVIMDPCPNCKIVFPKGEK